MKITVANKVPARKDIAQIIIDPKRENLMALVGGRKKITISSGKLDSVNARKLVLLSRRVISSARAAKAKKVALNFKDFRFPKLGLSDERIAEVMAIGFEMANYEFVHFKTTPPEGWNFVEQVFVAGKLPQSVIDSFNQGQLVGQEVNASRDLSNCPASEMTPKILADKAIEAVRGTKIKVRILNQADIKKLKMGGVLGVAQGSTERPCFIVLEYFGGKKDEKPIVLIGKGVTFDSGGINLKPTEALSEMQMDMSGGSTVIHSLVAAAKLKVPKNIVGLVPAVENMASGSSIRPGDILRSMSGKTIEILNTDAEGRVILADALEYSRRYNPRLVVDVATLTGAAMVALGQRACAIFTKDQKLEDLFRNLGEESGDYVWPLPLWDEYEEEVKGTFGDVANHVKTRYGGAIHGAAFLAYFAKGLPWVHIDMAPRMTSVSGEFLAQGASGCPVRLLVKLLEQY